MVNQYHAAHRSCNGRVRQDAGAVSFTDFRSGMTAAGWIVLVIIALAIVIPIVLTSTASKTVSDVARIICAVIFVLAFGPPQRFRR